MKPTLKQRLQYFFDSTLSKGMISIIIWLTIITIFLLLIFTFVYLLVHIKFEDSGRLSFWEAFWQALMRTIDTGTVAGDINWRLRIIGIIITFTGILIFSSLIGIITSGLEDKLNELRKGRSLVIVSNHTLILGWTQKAKHIIKELIIANENQKNPSIVILATKDKVEIEDEIKKDIPNTKNTKIICRTGDPLIYNDLEIVVPDNAKSIIILPPEFQDTNMNDIYVIKTILALVHNPNRKNKKYHIVSEISEKENVEAALSIGNEEVSIIFTREIIAKLIAQTSRQNGLSLVYMDLLDYQGDEIYFQYEPAIIGKTYKEVLFLYETSAVIGIRRKNGNILLNPPMDTVFEAEDSVIAISEDDDTIKLNHNPQFSINQSIIKKQGHKSSMKREKNMILGWNKHAEMIIRELENYVLEGSEIILVTFENSQIEPIISELNKSLKKQTIYLKQADYSKKLELLLLDIHNLDNIIILASEDIDKQRADAITILTLIHIRNILKDTSKKVNVISEMYDPRNRQLAEITQADDFIISQDLISRLLAQISENKDLKKVFDSLFQSEGSEIYLKDAEDYIQLGVETDFYTILEAASLKKETAIGYRKIQNSHNPQKNYGIVLNPNKSEKIKFEIGDKIIVLSED